jgi:hypothetical protein
MPLWIIRLGWMFQKIIDRIRPLNEGQRDELVKYYHNVMRIFDAIGIDINSKPAEQRRLYTVMLVYLDRGETICPSGARTAMLIGLLNSFDSGWILPPASQAVSAEVASEIEGYVAMELLGNNNGIGDICEELKVAINQSKGRHVDK